MGKKITVEILAEETVEYAVTVEMEKTDFDEYERIVNSALTSRQVDEAVEGIAFKYGLAKTDNIVDTRGLREVTFNVIRGG